ENRSFVLGGSFASLWGSQDLNSSDPNPATVFFATTVDAKGTPGSPQTVVDQVDDRAEPFVVEHPSQHAVAAWTDLRAKHADPQNGQIQLYAATLDAQMKEGKELVFQHARFIESTSDLGAM